MTDLLTRADALGLVAEWLSVFAPVLGFALILALLILHRVWELHHGYYGLVLLVWPDAPLWLRAVGFVLLLDDAMQHAIQIVKPRYRSPIHRLYQAVCGPLHRKLVVWWATR